MVEANTDPAVVTAVIERETREAVAESAAAALHSRAESEPTGPAPVVPVAPPVHVAVAATPEPPPAGAPSSGPGISGGTRIFFAGVLVLVLVWAWFAERRGGQKGN